MPRTLGRPLPPLTVGFVVGLLAVAALSGCTPTPSPTSSESSAASTPSASASATTGLSASPTPTPSPTPIAIACSALITNDTMYAFNPNFGQITSWKPASGSDAATAVSEKGLACRWQNQTSGDTIDVSVAHLDPASIESLKNAAVEASTMVPTYGDEAYFSEKNGVGTAIVFQSDYWLVATSVDFAEPGDPSDLIDAALAQLK